MKAIIWEVAVPTVLAVVLCALLGIINPRNFGEVSAAVVLVLSGIASRDYLRSLLRRQIEWQEERDLSLFRLCQRWWRTRTEGGCYNRPTVPRETTLNLGAEHDPALLEALMIALRELGASVSEADRALGGSQERLSIVTNIAGVRLLIESETYIGLTLKGDQQMVKRVAERTRQILAS